MTMLTSDWTVLPGEPCELGEGIRLVGPSDRLVMVDILAGRLLSVEPRTELLALDVPLGAVAPRSGAGAGSPPPAPASPCSNRGRHPRGWPSRSRTRPPPCG